MVEGVLVFIKHIFHSGRGCGAVGRAFASVIRDPGFKSQHRQSVLNLSAHICQLQFRKDENKEKGVGVGPLKKPTSFISQE